MRTLAACLLMLLLAAPAWAGNGHYVNGLEGIKCATVPPPGFYLRTYAVTYNADDLKDENGEEMDLGYDLDLASLALRPIWVTDKKILGADFAMHAIIPFQYTHVEMDKAGVSDTRTGLGDIDIAPAILAWHLERFDLAVSYELFLPTGEYDKTHPASPGKNFWTHMFSAGATAYLDESRSWSASVLGRYEIHSENEDTDVTYGDDFQIEWGVGKQIGPWEVGVAGFAHWQVTDDSGEGVIWDEDVHDSNYAAGPEVNYFFKPLMLNVGFRALQEFGTEDGPEGFRTILTLTKIF